MAINDARILLKKKIIGVTCHNSMRLAKIAIKNNADYLAFGAFNISKTKKVKFRANVEIIKRLKKLSDIPIVAIGGINNVNYKKLLLNKADFLAISGYIWNNKKLKPTEAIKLLK
jgi:thiamine-phosphate pyrophosphorylase